MQLGLRTLSELQVCSTKRDEKRQQCVVMACLVLKEAVNYEKLQWVGSKVGAQGIQGVLGGRGRHLPNPGLSEA